MLPSSGAPGGVLHTDDILIRGDEAARAKPIDLIKSPSTKEVHATGPWADELERTREEARDAGFRQGRHEGNELGLGEGRTHMETELARTTAEAEEELARLRTSVASVTAGLEERVADLSVTTNAAAVDLALEIAAAVLGREIAAMDDPGAAAIVRCLELAPATGELNAHLNPDDLEVLGEVPGLEGRMLKLIPDPTIASGDAIITVDEATIDGRLSESLRRVGEALR